MIGMPLWFGAKDAPMYTPEDGELHAEEGERHADRQQPEERAEVHGEVDGDERELGEAVLDLVRGRTGA